MPRVAVLGPWILTAALGSVASVAQGSEAEADALVAEGEALGKARQFDAALERFRAAELAAPRAVHDCWIAMTHLRLEQLPQAQLHLDRCRARAGGKAPVPWAAGAESRIRAQLTRGRYAPVDVNIEPAGADFRVAVLGLDTAVAAPTRIWLPLGTHTLIAERKGWRTRSVPVLLATPEPYAVHVVLEAEPEPAVAAKPSTPPAPLATTAAAPDDIVPVALAPPRLAPRPTLVATAPPPAHAHGPWPFVSAGAGAAAIAAGVAFHVEAFALYDRAAADPDGFSDEEAAALERNQALAYVGYGVGAAALTLAILLWTEAL